MKRSRNLKLVLIAAAAPVAMSGCDSQPTGTIVQSVAECSSAANLSLAQCQEAYQKAQLSHQQTAPRYASRADCENDFLGCTAVNDSSGTSFVPPMAGFLVGYALASRNDAYGGGYIHGVSPLYRNYRSGKYYNGNADYIGKGSGVVTGKHGRYSPPARAITISRAGFGSSSAARSAFSGSRGGGWGG